MLLVYSKHIWKHIVYLVPNARTALKNTELQTVHTFVSALLNDKPNGSVFSLHCKQIYPWLP